MRRSAMCLLLLLPLALASMPCAPAQSQSGPPHAWLFGAWSGGLFPASSTPSAQACLGQPTVIFTRDVVLRATLTDVTYVQRVIVTARATAGETDIVFTPAVDALAANSSGLLGLAQPKAAAGFGCESADVLHVKRISDTEVQFPGCSEFPNPLVRCPSR